MKNYVSKEDILAHILTVNPDFFKYNIGERVLITHTCILGIKEGVITDRGFSVRHSWDVAPKYRVKYGNGEFDSVSVCEDNMDFISNNEKLLDTYKVLKEEQNKHYNRIKEIDAELKKLTK